MDIINLGIGVDTVVIGTVANDDIDVITGFGIDDKLSFNVASYVNDVINYDGEANLNDAIQAVILANWVPILGVQAMGFQYVGSGYVVINDGDPAYNAGVDAVVQLNASVLPFLTDANFIV